MNVLLALIFLLAAKMVAAETGKVGCSDDAGCSYGECCVSGLFIFDQGNYCQSLVKEGEPCIPGEDILKAFNGNYFLGCPCMKGLTCTAGFYVDLPFFGKISFNETCTSDGNTGSSTAAATSKEAPATASIEDTKSSSSR